MILTTTYSKLIGISPPMEKYNFIIERIDSRREIVNIFSNSIQINILNKPSLPNRISVQGTTLCLFFSAFIISSINKLSIYYKKILNRSVSIHV